MERWYLRKELASEKNGLIVCEREWGRWNVYVGGFDQSTGYTETMWKEALERVPPGSTVERVLVLGLGGGGILKLIYARFPDCKVVAVEWDPMMIEVANYLGALNASDETVVIVEDATKAVPALGESFDLVIVDLFTGPNIAPSLLHDDFISSLTQHLKPQGSLLLNAFRNLDLLPKFDGFLSRQETWTYQYNVLCWYTHKKT